MSEIFEALILGIVQGITEFLPVSSSGHLELFKYILGDTSTAEQSLMTTVFLHFATALATLMVFRKDVWSLIRSVFSKTESEGRNYSYYILASMVPAALVGFFMEDLIASFFYQRLGLVGLALIFTGCLLWASERIKAEPKPLNIFRSSIIGISQAIAILPGISRSGSTIATSLILGVEKKEAAKFSFLMVVPLIFGKICKDLLSGDLIAQIPSVSYLLVGFIAAFLTGVWSCKFMIKVVSASKLIWFSYYCFAVGVMAIVFSITS